MSTASKVIKTRYVMDFNACRLIRAPIKKEAVAV